MNVASAGRVSGLLRAAGRGRYALAAAIVLVGVIPEFLNPVFGDTAWLLLTASRWLDGARLYRDVIETNPPLIIWLDAVLVALARTLDISPVTVFRVAVVGLLLGSVTLVNVLLTRLSPDEPGRRRILVLVLLFLLFPLAREEFGQREHLFLSLLLPYLTLLACRAAGTPISPRPAAAVGALAGLGFSIKPYFGVVWAALTIWQWRTLRPQRLRWPPETVAAGIVLLLYPLVIVAVTPEYITFVRRFAKAYSAYSSNSLLVTALLGDGSWLAIGALAAYLLLRPSLPTRHFWDAVAVAAAGGFLSAVLQHKGWRYHFYPSLSLGFLLLSGLTLDLWQRGRMSVGRRAVVLLTFAGVLTMLSTTVWYAARRVIDGLHWERSIAGRQILWTRSQPEERLMMVHYGWAEATVAFHAGKTPVSRVAILLPEDPGSHGPALVNAPAPRTPAEMGFAERTLFRMTVEDFVAADPVLLMVPEPSQRIDFLAYLARDSSFDRLLQRYTYIATVEGRHVFRRLRTGERRMLRPVSPVAIEERQVPLLLGYRKRRAPVFLGFLVLLLYLDYRMRLRARRQHGGCT